jgi:serine/threonine-protein kinase PRP4
MFFIFGFRDEDEQDDFEKRMALKLAEQEEEDLNRIKEESRKRREAILEKYRNQHLQQQNESRSEDADKGTFPVLVMFYIYS